MLKGDSASRRTSKESRSSIYREITRNDRLKTNRLSGNLHRHAILTDFIYVYLSNTYFTDKDEATRAHSWCPRKKLRSYIGKPVATRLRKLSAGSGTRLIRACLPCQRTACALKRTKIPLKGTSFQTQACTKNIFSITLICLTHKPATPVI